MDIVFAGIEPLVSSFLCPSVLCLQLAFGLIDKGLGTSLQIISRFNECSTKAFDRCHE